MLKSASIWELLLTITAITAEFVSTGVPFGIPLIPGAATQLENVLPESGLAVRKSLTATACCRVTDPLAATVPVPTLD